MSGDVQGVEELQRNLAALKNNFTDNIAKALVKGGRLVQSATVKSIQKKEGSGRNVIRKHKGQKAYSHIASLEGQAPNSDTGELVRGIQMEVKEDDVFVGVEKSQDDKALGLEFGTADGRLKPRPFLHPALEKNRDKINKLVLDAIQKEVLKNG